MENVLLIKYERQWQAIARELSYLGLGEAVKELNGYFGHNWVMRWLVILNPGSGRLVT